MSSGELTNVLANAVGRIDFRPKQPQFDFPNTYPLNGDLSAGLCYPTFEQLEPVLLGHDSCTCIKKTNNNNNTNNTKAGIQKQMHVSVVSYTTFCSSNQLYRGRRKYCYCIKICCNRFIQIKVYRVYCAHNVLVENVQHYCMPNKLWERKLLHKKGNNYYIVSNLMWIIILEEMGLETFNFLKL